MNKTPTSEDLKREDELWAARQRGERPKDRHHRVVKSDPNAWFAYKLWYEGGWPISEAAREFGVSRDAVMASFEKNSPIIYKLFMARLSLALGFAGVLAVFHSRLKRFRDAIERAIS